MKKSCEANGLPRRRLVSQEALRLLMAYDWPGNIRQFENAIEYAVAMSADGRRDQRRLLPEEIRSGAQSAHGPVR